jgi:CheY-like chemotaxis protein
MGTALAGNTGLGPPVFPGGLCTVEDDSEYVFVLQQQLDPYGVPVFLARNHLEALQAAEAGCRIFFLDVHLGHADPTGGLNALAEIKHRFPDAFCVMLTVSAAHRQEAGRHGCDLYIVKTDNFAQDVNRVLIDASLRLLFGPEEVRSRRSQLQRYWNSATLIEESALSPVRPMLHSLLRSLEAADTIDADNALRQIVHLTDELKKSERTGDASMLAASCIGNSFRNTVTAGKNQFDRLLLLTRILLGFLERPLTFERAADLKFELEEEGYETAPPAFQQVFEGLLDLGLDHSEESLLAG